MRDCAPRSSPDGAPHDQSPAARHGPRDTGRVGLGTTLTLAEIADLLDRDLKTIKTWLAKGRWPNAVQDATDRRTWRVPVADLVASDDLDADQITHVEGELAARRESRETNALRDR